MRRHRVLLPGITVLTRLVSTVRETAAERAYTMLTTAAMELDPMLAGRLRSSLAAPEGARFSELESWRQAPTRGSGPGMVRALDRAAELSGLRVRKIDCSAVPANRTAARTHLETHGCPVREEDAVRLSPLGHAHLNELGRYTFPTHIPDAGLRPLRDPDNVAEPP